MRIGFRPRVKVFHPHGTSPPIPPKWSVSAMITFEPSPAGGSSSAPLGAIQSAGLAKRSAFEPPGHATVMPMGCCFGLPASWLRASWIMWYCQSLAVGSLSLLIS
jgi:hypothetical protein